MAYNFSGWGTAAPNADFWVGYVLNGGQDFGPQWAQAKPEGASIDGTQNGSFICTNHEIHLDVASQKISYSFVAHNTSNQSLSFMLCGGGVT